MLLIGTKKLGNISWEGLMLLINTLDFGLAVDARPEQKELRDQLNRLLE